ncbi:hypothetical protein MVEN_01682500 [Mycena venus]|uniref:Cytochrome P450 n=1 Tax=Mycena venus TaxID=2733690 RepID=A0A8H6XLN7_9AGAR|nr:hypothetical protein MVEN_01682500 [Mycena venus]
MEVPPGPTYLARVLPITFLPTVVTYVFLARILPVLDLGLPSLPVWSCVLAALITQPVGVVITYIYKEFQHARDAASRGAVSIPAVYDKWPGGFSLIGALRKSSYPGDFLLDWCDRYGNTFMAKILYGRLIFTTEPEHIKAILSTEFDNYWKGPDASHMGQSLLGFGIFNTDDEMWKFHRTMTRPFFNRERISDFDLFDRHTHDILSRMKQRLAEGFAIDIQDCVSRFTLDSAAEFLVGKSVDSASAGLPYPESAPIVNSAYFLNHPSNIFVTAFSQGQVLMMDRVAYSTKWPLVEFWKDRVKPHREIADAFIEPILNAALEKRRAAEQAGTELEEEHTTFLSHLVQATDSVSSSFVNSTLVMISTNPDKEVIRDSIFNILVAGRDTARKFLGVGYRLTCHVQTAATLTFAVYMLAEHPHMEERLRKEILDVVGSSRMPTYDDLRNMKYLRAFINETLRLYPPVPSDSRTSKNATTWPPIKPADKPLYVTPNTRIRYNVFLMHRRKDLWGPDALKFDPDRFLDDRVRKYLTPNPFIFLPFNAGPRICLGQQFAYNEASFFLVRLLQSFSAFSLAPDAQPKSTRPPESWKTCKGTQATEKIMLGTHVTMFAKGGLWVRMKEVPE